MQVGVDQVPLVHTASPLLVYPGLQVSGHTEPDTTVAVTWHVVYVPSAGRIGELAEGETVQGAMQVGVDQVPLVHTASPLLVYPGLQVSVHTVPDATVVGTWHHVSYVPSPGRIGDELVQSARQVPVQAVPVQVSVPW